MRFMKTTAVALALAVGGLTAPLPTVQDADAGHRNWHDNKRVVKKRVNKRVVVRRPGVRVVDGRYWYGGRYYDESEALAAGLLGFAAGAIVAGALAQPRVVEAAPVVVAPAGVVVAGVPEPYSPEWYAQCDVKYKSFDPESATYLGYDGQRHLCQLP